MPSPTSGNLRILDENVQRIATSDLLVRRAVDAGNKLSDDGDWLAFQRNLRQIVRLDQPEAAPLRNRLLAQLEDSARGPRPGKSGLTEFPLSSKYVGETVGDYKNWVVADGKEQLHSVVTYYTAEEREQSRLYLKKGQLNFGGRPLEPGEYIFVVDRNGNLIAGRPWNHKIHHSSLSGGEPVLMAGEIHVPAPDDNNKKISITNASGHFRPDREALEHLLVALRDGGLDTTNWAAFAVETKSRADGRAAVDSPLSDDLLREPEKLRSAQGPMLQDLRDRPSRVPAPRKLREESSEPTGYRGTDADDDDDAASSEEDETASVRDIFDACLRSMLLSCSPTGSQAIGLPLTG